MDILLWRLFLPRIRVETSVIIVIPAYLKLGCILRAVEVMPCVPDIINHGTVIGQGLVRESCQDWLILTDVKRGFGMIG